MKQEPSILMKKEYLTIKKHGFSIVEAILSMAIFMLITTALIGIIIYGKQSTSVAGERARAIFLAEEGLEAVRNIKNEDFTNLIDGTYGLNASTGEWEFSGTSDSTENFFTREIIISTIDSDRKQIASKVTWQQSVQITGEIFLTTQFTNWSVLIGNQTSSLVVDTTNANLDPSDDSEVIGITIENTGSTNIIIDKIIVSWIGGKKGNNVKTVIIDNQIVWTGNEKSGSELDIIDFVLSSYTTYPFTEIKFKKGMIGAELSLTFILSDGSQKTINGITL